MDFVPTRGSLSKNDSNVTYTSVIHKNYKSQHRKNVNTDEECAKDADVDKISEFNIKRARQEVIRFGISGFDTKTQEEARIQAAVKLGAKPPKKKNINYKELLDEKKKEKLKTKEADGFLQIGKNKFGKSTAIGKSFYKKRKGGLNKKTFDITDNYGKVKLVKK